MAHKGVSKAIGSSLAITLLLIMSTAKAQEVITFDTVVNATTPIYADTLITSQTDSITIAKEGKTKKRKGKTLRPNHSPQKATIMSACLPGLGQIYNGKWWKTPIIYGGFGALGYFDATNIIKYKRYLLAYRCSTGNLKEGEVPTEEALALAETYSSDQLQSYKNKYLRNVEIFSLVLAVWYGLNIVDACVDGHLYYYDVSEDLSISIEPYIPRNDVPTPINIGYTQLGVTLRFNLK